MKNRGDKPYRLNFAEDALDFLLKTHSKGQILKLFEEVKPKFDSRFANINIYYGTA